MIHSICLTVQAKSKDKSKKKKKKKVFEMPVEEEAEVLSESEDDAEQEAATSAAFAAKRKPKKGKKSGFVMPADEDAEPAGAPVEIEIEAVEAADVGLVTDRVEPLFADGKSKKKKSKSSKADVASAFAALDLGGDAAEASLESAVASEEIFAAGRFQSSINNVEITITTVYLTTIRPLWPACNPVQLRRCRSCAVVLKRNLPAVICITSEM